jgi:hypothetical protein
MNSELGGLPANRGCIIQSGTRNRSFGSGDGRVRATAARSESTTPAPDRQLSSSTAVCRFARRAGGSHAPNARFPTRFPRSFYPLKMFELAAVLGGSEMSVDIVRGELIRR